LHKDKDELMVGYSDSADSMYAARFTKIR